MKIKLGIFKIVILLIVGFLIFYFSPKIVFGTTTFSTNKEANEFKFKNGNWISLTDSLAGIKIKNQKWIIFYKGMKIDSSDIYNFKVTDQLPEYANTKLRTGKFLILTNKFDTLEYEILGHNEVDLSLMYFPRGNILTYKIEN